MFNLHKKFFVKVSFLVLWESWQNQPKIVFMENQPKQVFISR